MSSKSQKSLNNLNHASSRPPLAELISHAHNIKKEKQNIKIYDNFDINPAKFSLFPEKPNHVKPSTLKKEPTSLASIETASDDTDLDQQIKSKISRSFATPKEKFSFPQTSNQELGWFSDDTKTYAKNSCPETRYANVYYSNMRISPYSSKVK